MKLKTIKNHQLRIGLFLLGLILALMLISALFRDISIEINMGRETAAVIFKPYDGHR